MDYKTYDPNIDLFYARSEERAHNLFLSPLISTVIVFTVVSYSYNLGVFPLHFDHILTLEGVIPVFSNW